MPAKKMDDQMFSVRVLFFTPELGFDRLTEITNGGANEHIGPMPSIRTDY